MATRVEFFTDLRVDMDPVGESLRRIAAADGGVDKFTRDRADMVAGQARRTTLFRDRTGNLRRSIRTEQYRDPAGLFATGWQVVADTPYALIVHEGRGPVVAKTAQALRFEVGGKVIFAKSVRGTHPRPFLTEALQAVQS